MNEEQQRQQLIERIQRRRLEIDEFLDRARPRTNRLTVFSVVSSALAAAFTAGPAIGGPGMASAVQGQLGLPSESIVWQVLCLLALAVSIIAAICAALVRSQDNSSQVAAAEATNAELYGLKTMLEFGNLNVVPALGFYQQSVAKVAFVDEKLR
ncbi:hypothetical protein LWC34_35800 [Kibdelosporangium philippinense]|uniref:Uncharacterized protein n=1 Tax=Kibdelosporangium philippinense TaxID=211113 RepID=A0ABS8ZLW0_9PSEU|nr:hypothetical protein [Kibdelosporangium philippinense]MCE7008143.1 hypothetical protein [Kibdelosporangium philippinense]